MSTLEPMGVVQERHPWGDLLLEVELSWAPRVAKTLTRSVKAGVSVRFELVPQCYIQSKMVLGVPPLDPRAFKSSKQMLEGPGDIGCNI